MSNTIQINTPTRLLVVILNYRTAQLTIDCLQSLVQEVNALPGTQVVVTDNDSQDGSVEQIKTAILSNGWEYWVSLQPLPSNGGFAMGNNAAIRMALQTPHPPDYFLLLNPDTLVHPGALSELVGFMDKHPEAGLVGSRLENPDGSPQHSAFRFPSIWSELDQGLRLRLASQILKRWEIAPPISEKICKTDWLSGASLMVRHEVFASVGLLDEQYFMYYEELDFCLQAHKLGWQCWYVPQSRVIHLVGQSSGVNNSAKRRPQYWFNSRRRYFLKNHGWVYASIVDATWLVSFVIRRLRQMIQRQPNTEPPFLLTDFWANSIFLKGRQLK
jgi:N-acetylglucosaminyl-diphospho-decaprenol L-rhamnosyltransferase